MLSRHQDFGRCNLCAELEGRDGKTLELMYHIPKRLAPKITGAVAARDLSRRALELFPDRIYISDPFAITINAEHQELPLSSCLSCYPILLLITHHYVSAP